MTGVSVFSTLGTEAQAVGTANRIEWKVRQHKLPEPRSQIDPSVTSIAFKVFGRRTLLMKKESALSCFSRPDKLFQAPHTGEGNLVRDVYVDQNIGSVTANGSLDPSFHGPELCLCLFRKKEIRLAYNLLFKKKIEIF